MVQQIISWSVSRKIFNPSTKSFFPYTITFYVYIFNIVLRVAFDILRKIKFDQYYSTKLRDMHRQHQDTFTSRLITRFPVTRDYITTLSHKRPNVFRCPRRLGPITIDINHHRHTVREYLLYRDSIRITEHIDRVHVIDVSFESAQQPESSAPQTIDFLTARYGL